MPLVFPRCWVGPSSQPRATPSGSLSVKQRHASGLEPWLWPLTEVPLPRICRQSSQPRPVESRCSLPMQTGPWQRRAAFLKWGINQRCPLLDGDCAILELPSILLSFPQAYKGLGFRSPVKHSSPVKLWAMKCFLVNVWKLVFLDIFLMVTSFIEI